MKNALEETVANIYEQLRASHPEFCSCAQCQDDVVAHALNHARPRYVAGSTLGAAVTRVALSQDSARSEITVLVYEAMRLVHSNPRHAPDA